LEDLVIYPAIPFPCVRKPTFGLLSREAIGYRTSIQPLTPAQMTLVQRRLFRHASITCRPNFADSVDGKKALPRLRSSIMFCDRRYQVLILPSRKATIPVATTLTFMESR